MLIHARRVVFHLRSVSADPLYATVSAALSPDVEDNLRRQITGTDKAIDALVYELYGLTPEEIALVESATAPQSATAESP